MCGEKLDKLMKVMDDQDIGSIEDLRLLTTEDLKGFGVTVGNCRKIEQALKDQTPNSHTKKGDATGTVIEKEKEKIITREPYV